MIGNGRKQDLLAVFADEDAKVFFAELVRRGIERKCLAPFTWDAMRDPRRDSFVRNPLSTIRSKMEGFKKFLLIWDHEGSGFDDPKEAEEGVFEVLEKYEIDRERVGVAALVPELEIAIVPVWEKVKSSLAKKRKTVSPSDDEIHAELRHRIKRALWETSSIFDLLQTNPKECLQALVHVLDLRFSHTIFQTIGEQVSIREMKQSPQVHSLIKRLERWFPPGKE